MTTQEAVKCAEPAGEIWKHGKSGGLYELVASARMERDGVDGAKHIVYRSLKDGCTWIRPAAEFFRKFSLVCDPVEKPEPYLIERLWTDMMENQPSAAIGYRPIGVVMGKAVADVLVAEAGFEHGDGWPIRRGEQMPKLRAKQLPWIDGVPK